MEKSRKRRNIFNIYSGQCFIKKNIKEMQESKHSLTEQGMRMTPQHYAGNFSDIATSPYRSSFVFCLLGNNVGRITASK
jgi:hypothetical protein